MEHEAGANGPGPGTPRARPMHSSRSASVAYGGPAGGIASSTICAHRTNPQPVDDSEEKQGAHHEAVPGELRPLLIREAILREGSGVEGGNVRHAERQSGTETAGNPVV